MTLKQKALAHYDRMIAWADKQPKRKMVDSKDMQDAIGENWCGTYCPYCMKRRFVLGCGICRLLGKIESRCCDGLWNLMHNALTWGTWVKRARKVREYIEKHG